MTSLSEPQENFTPRQQAVLDAALRLLVEEGDRVTMTSVARRANCSKETLYKWFGGRDGLLTATVQWQASKVRVAPPDGEDLDEAALRRSLEQFATDLLTVISSETSVALNRVAVSHAGTGGHDLGAIVLENGRFAMGEKLKPVFEMAREAGLLAFEDTEAVYQTFFGLVVRDVQIRLMLGDNIRLTAAKIAREAAAAVRQFLTLYGVPRSGPKIRQL